MAVVAPQLLDPQQASAYLSVPQRRLTDPTWRRRFHLPAIHVGRRLRFDVETLRQWLQDRQDRFDGSP